MLVKIQQQKIMKYSQEDAILITKIVICKSEMVHEGNKSYYFLYRKSNNK